MRGHVLVSPAALLRTGASDQHAITDRLSWQVRQAVEVLIRSLDRADQDSRRELLKDVPASELYEAAVTVMMRLVFLSAAEERGLGGDRLYDKSYSLSTIERIAKNKKARRHDAWNGLLSSFRAVFGGTHHERMKLSACPGNLFDPDRKTPFSRRSDGQHNLANAGDQPAADRQPHCVVPPAVGAFRRNPRPNPQDLLPIPRRRTDRTHLRIASRPDGQTGHGANDRARRREGQ